MPLVSSSRPPKHSKPVKIHKPVLVTGDEIEDFFNSGVDILKRAKSHTKSLHTRPPGLYDQHLHTELRLRRVIKLSALPYDLCTIAQDTLDSASTLPHFNKAYKEHIKRGAIKACEVRCEDDIKDFYRTSVATGCAMVAGTLLKGSNWSASGLLEWSGRRASTQQVQGINDKEVIADGFLNIVGKNVPLDQNEKKLLSCFPEVVIWEFKNLNFCDDDRLTVPPAFLKSWFPWRGCEHGTECTAVHPNLGVKAVRMGHDSDHHPCATYQIMRGENRDDPVGVAPLNDHSDERSRNILQQASNLEMIGIRDRRQQTLYISDVFTVRDCKYRKIHTGLYIAAYNDAKIRTQLLEKSTPKTWYLKSGVEATYTLDFQELNASQDTTERLFSEARTRKLLKITPVPKNMTYQPFSRELYRRTKSLTEMDNDDAPNPTTKDIIELLATSPFYQSRICRATLEIPGAKYVNGYNRPTVIIKTAVGDEKVRMLLDEYHVYRELHCAKVQNVAEVFGFFCYKDKEDPDSYLAALVLEDKGTSLRQLRSEERKLRGATKKLNLKSDRTESFLKTLQQIHAAGYLHGNITPKSLLISDDNEVAIIGFKAAIQNSSKLEQEAEEEILLKSCRGSTANASKENARNADKARKLAQKNQKKM
ncbi:hypothetical protein H0H92_014344 [Tricholoma furcatifolium]|nr:hypothetical protein H0H92_014344 [Tricholoma furcatifolium]